MKNIFLNRYTITFGTILLIILLWNIYVARNNDGIITGIVEDQYGNPVPQATVSLYEVGTAGLLFEPKNTETDENGRFTYTDHNLIEFTIDVSKEGFLRSEKKRYHTLFKKQNFELPEPIVLTQVPSP